LFNLNVLYVVQMSTSNLDPNSTDAQVSILSDVWRCRNPLTVHNLVALTIEVTNTSPTDCGVCTRNKSRIQLLLRLFFPKHSLEESSDETLESTKVAHESALRLIRFELEMRTVKASVRVPKESQPTVDQCARKLEALTTTNAVHCKRGPLDAVKLMLRVAGETTTNCIACAVEKRRFLQTMRLLVWAAMPLHEICSKSLNSLEDRHKSDLLLVCCEQEKRADLAPSDES
jgi:hypothetical protein